MKILTAKQIKQADTFTIEHEPISSIDLMERAAKKSADWIITNQDKAKTFKLFCGVGNNGGDGLAIARMLHEVGCNVSVYEITFTNVSSDDFTINKERLIALGIPVLTISAITDIPTINKNELVIDAIFGTGLSRQVNRFLARIFHVINQSEAIVISIDMPSGLFAENNANNKLVNVIKANFTLTFQCPKLAYFLPESNYYFGHLQTLDINLHPTFIDNVKTPYSLTSLEHIKNMYKTRPRFVHKGDMGRALLVAGSYGKMGACVLAAKACKRSGIGLLMVHSPKCGYTILQSVVPEAMALVDKSETAFTEGLDTSSYDVIAVGPGIGTKKSTRKALTFLIKQTEQPMVLDADALNILAAQPELLKHLPANSIMTPHRGEWERICGIPTSNSLAQLHAARKFAKTHKITIVLKDAITAIIDVKGNVYFNSTGNSGLATGGSGDVLTGIITGLMAQSYTSLEAAKLGVYIHGKAADIAIQKTQSPESLIASDVVEYLGEAFGSITNI